MYRWTALRRLNYRVARFICVFELLLIGLRVFSQTIDPSMFAGSGGSALVVQPDGQMLVGSSYSVLRFNTNGTGDTSFNGFTDSSVYSIALQDDGRMVVGGWFTLLDNEDRMFIGRLNADGTLDTNFDLGLYTGWTFPGIYSVTIQPDQSFIVCGDFEKTNSPATTNIMRVLPDATVDPSLRLRPNDIVYCSGVQLDGKILIGGAFTTINGLTRTRIARINRDGTIDSTFTNSLNGLPLCFAVQPNGQILVGGAFTNFSGALHQRIARFNADGTIDSNFVASANSVVRSMVLQADGKILVAGDFTNLNGVARTYLGRLNSDGTLDTNFNITISSNIVALQMQGDGKILISGSFANVGGVSRGGFARILNTDPPIDTMTLENGLLTWTRGGTAPEITRARFDVSLNGGPWNEVPDVGRTPTGWQVDASAFPPDATYRARGYALGSRYNASTSLIESGYGPVSIGLQPVSQTNRYARSVLFKAKAAGSPPLSYQWYKNGQPITNGNGVMTAGQSTLALTSIAGADQGTYYVVVTNATGAVTSSNATLRVIDPWFTSQPGNLFSSVGQSPVFQVSVAGTAPLTYQWRLNGTPVAATTSPSLTVTNVQRANVGYYDVVVSNAYGTAISQPGSLSVNFAVADAFNSNLFLNSSAGVSSAAFQTDGKVLMCYNGANSGLRLNSDGTWDTNFSVIFDHRPFCWSLPLSGGILVGGLFAQSPGAHLARLKADSSIDTAYTPKLDSNVTAIAIINSSNVLVVGPHAVGTNICNGLAMLGSDGRLTSNFAANVTGTAFCLAPQTDGKILVGGRFTALSGQSVANIGRLNRDGTTDPSFNASADSTVMCMAVQADGKILIGGAFTNVDAQLSPHLARLNADGSFDPSFTATANSNVVSVVLQANGRSLIAGDFTTVSGQYRTAFARLESDGAVDPTFCPAPYYGIYSTASGLCVALQNDGRIFVGGIFSSIGGQTRYSMARLTNPDPTTNMLSFDGSRVQWLRGGASPEVWRTTFECSTASNQWIYLGEGSRIAGGWQLRDVAVPVPCTIRARGYTAGGQWNGSSWYVESTLPISAPAIIAPAWNGSANQLSFGVTGNAGQPCVIERSTDLQSWMPVLTNILPLNVSESNGSDSTRFYRARLP